MFPNAMQTCDNRGCRIRKVDGSDNFQKRELESRVIRC